jgi:xylose isomerase
MSRARSSELAEPTLAPGETLDDLRTDDSFDVEAAGRRGMGYELLDQLALDHLFGVR